VKSILNELLLNPPKGYRVEPVYSTTTSKSYKYAKKFTFEFLGIKDIQSIDTLIDFKKGDIFLGLDLAQHIVASNVEYYKKLQAFGVKTYFVVYDLLPIFYENDFPKEWDLKTTHTNWLEVIKESSGALCISKSVEKELLEYLEKNPSNSNSFLTDSFHLGADLENSKPSKGFLSNSKIVLESLAKRTTFLVVGTLEPRKSHKQTLEAFENLWNDSIEVNLVIVGKVGWLVDELVAKLKKHSQLNERLFWLEGISDEYLQKVYENADCLISPSKAEGFGLPLIEAARYDLPIIARDIPIFQEVAQHHAYYFQNDDDPKTMSESIKKWLDLYKQHNHPKSTDMPWLTWEESLSQLLKPLLDNNKRL
ncbi:MAG: glycosyltransferase family 1 protein, partial [Arcobacteraceae bacterium]